MPEKVVAVGLILPQVTKTSAEEHLEELAKLIETAGGTVVSRVFAKRNAPDAATYVGKGKAEEVKSLYKRDEATLVVFDDDLSPAQIRNLSKIIDGKVIDRSALILDIFANRARSREARTQVELAQLSYMLPRLTRAWTHLERQAGGIGTRGVGETQLEIDRRIVRTRIARLKTELEKIEQHRDTQRKSRQGVFTVALVGYTNAGKSTLFNRLTRGGAEAMDKLFATLDAKSQKAAFEMPRETVIIDTVGFIRKLPHHLVASFRSTMEEAATADLVLHLVDASHPHFEEQRQVGDRVLSELGVDPHSILEVYNKSDRLGDHERPAQRQHGVLVSATTGDGIDRLIALIRDHQLAGGEVMHLRIPHTQSREIAALHELAEVQKQRDADDGMHAIAWVPMEVAFRFEPFRDKAAEAAANGAAKRAG